MAHVQRTHQSVLYLLGGRHSVELHDQLGPIPGWEMYALVEQTSLSLLLPVRSVGASLRSGMSIGGQAGTWGMPRGAVALLVTFDTVFGVIF